MRLTSLRQSVLGFTLAGVIGLGGAAGVLAQDDAAAEGNPAHIHVGTCADLDPNPVAPLNTLMPVGTENDDDDNDDAEATQEVMGVLTVGPVAHSESDEIEFSWEDMLASSHAIAVHESEANIDNYIACGDIGGVVFDDDGNKMVIGLHPVGDSGFSGIAILSEDGDGEVDVEVYVTGQPTSDEAPEDEVEATPAS